MSLPTAASPFQFCILRQGWLALNLGYQAQTAQPILKAIPPQEYLCAFGLNDLDGYDWDQQTLTLTGAATQTLAQALAGREASQAGVRALTKLKKSLGWGNAVERALYTKGFVVRVQGQPLYGGIFLDAVSQMAIDYPVARVALQADRATLSLLPIHIPFTLVDPVAGNGQRRGVAAPAEAQADLRDLEAKSNFVTNWIYDLATRPSAQAFRAVMRDPAVRALLETAGKLQA